MKITNQFPMKLSEGKEGAEGSQSNRSSAAHTELASIGLLAERAALRTGLKRSLESYSKAVLIEWIRVRGISYFPEELEGIERRLNCK